MKKRNFKVALFSLFTITALMIGTFATGAVFASGSNHSVQSSGGVSVSAQKGSSQTVNGQSMNVRSLPQEGNSPAKNHTSLPLGVSPNLAAAKKNASHNMNAPRGGTALADPGSTTSEKVSFNGMADSATICPFFGGCQPPDMALATSPQFVFQGVNTSFALYDNSGHRVAGPVNSQVFFGVPNPKPAGCDPAGPFMSDPRAFYDPNTGLFWAAMLQIENVEGAIGPKCKFLSQYWIANFNPTSGAGCVYNFDMALGTKNFADYTQFGFSGKTIAFTGNMFNQAGTAYKYAETQFANKHAMEQCKPVTTDAFTHLKAGSVLVDTVQPVETETPLASDPGVQYLVNSFNGNGDPFGHDCLTTACEGFIVWAYDPATHSLGGALTGLGIPTPLYVSPPNADQPGCTQCVETIDTRITGTPVYSVGGGQPLISFSLDTAVNNGGAGAPSVVPGILWGQIQVTHFSSGTAPNLYQSGYLFFSGDRDASFGAMMQDKNGNLFMVFDTMSANLNPSIMLVSRSKSEPLGTIDHASFIIRGPSATFDSRWGDYEAASYTGFGSNEVWVASQYSISGDWATRIARVS